MTNSRGEYTDEGQSPVDYAPGATPDRGDEEELSAAKTDTGTSDTAPVRGSDPGPDVGDTTGDDRLGADDSR